MRATAVLALAGLIGLISSNAFSDEAQEIISCSSQYSAGIKDIDGNWKSVTFKPDDAPIVIHRVKQDDPAEGWYNKESRIDFPCTKEFENRLHCTGVFKDVYIDVGTLRMVIASEGLFLTPQSRDELAKGGSHENDSAYVSGGVCTRVTL